MPHIYTLAFFLFFVLKIFAQLPPETDPHRGMYVDRFLKTNINNSSVVEPAFSILSVDTNSDGIFEKEDAVLQYACENHITYLALYDMGRILGRSTTAWNENTRQYERLEKHLCRFIQKAKNQYGITQIGAIGGSEDLFDSVATFMNRYPVINPGDTCSSCQADIDVINVEYEFWGSCATDIVPFIGIIQKMYSVKQSYNAAHPDNPIITEAYVAFVNPGNCSNPGVQNVVQIMDGCKNCSPYTGLSNPHPRLIDRILYTTWMSTPGNVGFTEANYFEDPSSFDSTDFHPMLYSEANKTGGRYNFLGPWLASSPQNTIFFAEEYYYYHWLLSSNAAHGLPRMNDVQPGGVHWFTATHMVGVLDNPKVVLTPGPFCTGDSSKITLNYYGPDEPGTRYEFWITNDSTQATVYPKGGGKFSGLSQWTVNDPGNRSINFSDTTIFPALYLTEGRYTAHITLAYNMGMGCTYAYDAPVYVHSQPRLQITGDSSFCHGGQSFILAPTGGSWYSWKRNGKYYYAGSGNQISVYESGYYSCEISGGSCTGFTDTVYLNVKPMPFAYINASCNGNGTVTLKTDLQIPNSNSTELSGTGGVTYRWNTGETTDQITVTASGKKDYTVQITDPYSGCWLFRRITLPNTLTTGYTASIQVDQLPSTCNHNGQLTAVLTPPPLQGSPMEYLWSTGQTTATIYNVAPGTYSVAVSIFQNACSFFSTATIGTPPVNAPILNEVVTPSSCNNKPDGSIILNPIGGNPPFTYLWQHIPDINGYHSDAKDQNNLYPGNYTVVVSDSLGCDIMQTFHVDHNSSPISVTPASITPVSGCGTNQNGAASISISGGQPPYAQSWTDHQGNSYTPGSNLYSGSYRVIVTDIIGCTGSTFIHVPNQTLPIRLHYLDSSTTDLPCLPSSGNIYVCIHGGNEPYSVNQPWVVDSNFSKLINIPAGTYPLQVTDNTGCIEVDTFEITTAAIQMTLSANHTTCLGCGDGSISIAASGGTAPYQVAWNPPVGTLTGMDIEGLTSGSYIVCITDSGLCQSCDTILVLEDPLTVWETGINGEIKIFPHPNKGDFTISFEGNLPDDVILEIHSIYGSKIFSERIKSSSNFHFKGKGLSEGVYILSISNMHSFALNNILLVVEK